MQLTIKDYEKALMIAKEAHKGQKRWNGDEYITHPIRIASKMENWRLKIIAVLHDVVEDTNVSLDDLKMFPKEITIPLQLLTHNKNQSYADYIRGFKWFVDAGSRYNQYAAKVKMADLEDNLKDLTQQQRIDKYELALLYLKENFKR